MTSSYRGVYVERHRNGQIHNVQVVAPGLILLTFSPSDYVAKGLQPPIDQLPDAEEYFAMLRKP